MSRNRLLLSLFVASCALALAGAANAACNPAQSPVGSPGCQPSLSTPQPTDLVMGWRPNLFPNSLGTYTMSDLSAYFTAAGGFVTGPGSTTVGDLAVWGNTIGTALTDLSLLPVANGGSGAATLAAHGVLLGQGTSALHVTAVGTNGQMLLGQSAADPAWETMSGDATLAAGGALTLATVNTNTGTIGDATHIPQITLDGKGRATAAVAVAITGTPPGGSAGGDLGGSYPNPTVLSVGDVNTGVLGATHGGAGSVTGALKGNGSGTVSQAACADLSNGATGCSTAIGTSGGTIPLLNGTNVWSGQQAVTPTTLSISTATFTPNGSSNNYALTLVHASCPCTLANPSVTPVAGTGGQIVVIQSATGSDTIGTWGSEYEAPGGTSTLTLSTAANAVDILSYYVRDSTHIELTLLANFSH
jgi:hypothetical protein